MKIISVVRSFVESRVSLLFERSLLCKGKWPFHLIFLHVARRFLLMSLDESLIVTLNAACSDVLLRKV